MIPTIYLIIIFIVATAGFVAGYAICNRIKWRSLNNAIAEMNTTAKRFNAAVKRQHHG